MKHTSLSRLLIAGATVGAAMMTSGAAHAGTNVGVNVSVHQPGFYGRIEIGQQPPPRVIYQQPMIIQQSPVAVVQQPIYLRVPPDHSRHWDRYCGRWRACGQPVYFVQSAPVVVQQRPGQWQGRDRDWDRDGDRHDHGRGHGRGHGHGHGHDR